MDYDDILAKVIDLPQRDKRVPYRVLKVRFQLDDDILEAIKDDLIYAKKWSEDEHDRLLVWIGDTDAVKSTAPEPATHATTTPSREPLSYTPAYLAEKILTGKTSLEGERKQVTVLFADIKDSTELIRDLDPEDAQKLLDPAIHIMMDAVHRFEGTVNQVLGDGIMSIFGAPIAHEDHAARACYAALAMQTAMQPYTDNVLRSHGITMQIRVGLNSGEVVVRTIGNDLHMDYSAVGQTTHLAARMEQIAMPGSVVLSRSTLRLVEGLVRVNERGPVPIKGMTEPVDVYGLTGASGTRRRLQAAVARGLTKFVGRNMEIEALNQARKRAENGNGQIIAAIGEAGVGKSRLVYEFIHSHYTQGWRVLESSSVSYGKATPYFPVVDLLKRYAHVEDGDDPRTVRAKVTGQILTLDESLQETIPALLSLLDALPEDRSFAQLEPPQRRQRMLDSLKQILLRESQVQPLLLVFEDLHWIDSETQALLDSMVESLPTAQFLLVVNYRPEYTHEWGSKTYYTQLRLDPLPPGNAGTLLASLLGDDSSLEPLKALLIERTEGNPFFLEECVRTLVETQVLAGEPGTYRMAQALPTIQVPATVQAILAARIDRLPQDEKWLLQTASVIGMDVPLSLLQAIAEISESILYGGLAHLQQSEFLYETSLFPERVYTFKHALTHDVAYDSLLQERRLVLHKQIVECLEAKTDDSGDQQVERLAQHAMCAELWDKAITYFQQAAANAMARFAHREAANYYEQALAALAHLPTSRATSEQAIDLRIDLRAVLHPSGDRARITANLREAEVLAASLNDARRQAVVSRLMLLYFLGAGELDRAVTVGQRALKLATSAQDINHIYQSLGIAYYDRGDYPQAINAFKQVIASLDREPMRERDGQFFPPLAVSHVYLSWGLADVGRFTEAMNSAEAIQQTAEEPDQPAILMGGYCSIGRVCLQQGDLGRAVLMLQRALAICQEMGLVFFEPLPAADLGSAYALIGRHSEAVPLLEQAVAQSPAVGRMYGHAWRVVQLGEAYRLAGRLEAARETAEHALDLARTHRQRGAEAWALWLLGSVSTHHNRADIEQALTLANELGMYPLQAHCHRDLGTLYKQTGQVEQARAELSTAIEMYHNMEMTFWLPETEAALAEVGSKA